MWCLLRKIPKWCTIVFLFTRSIIRYQLFRTVLGAWIKGRIVGFSRREFARGVVNVLHVHYEFLYQKEAEVMGVLLHQTSIGQYDWKYDGGEGSYYIDNDVRQPLGNNSNEYASPIFLYDDFLFLGYTASTSTASLVFIGTCVWSVWQYHHRRGRAHIQNSRSGFNISRTQNAPVVQCDKVRTAISDQGPL